MSWEPFSGDDAAWDAVVEALGGPVYQSSLWAAHKARSGWRPLRARRSDGTAAVQALAKRVGPAAVLWARGGPVGAPAAWDSELRGLLGGLAGSPLVYGRICPYHPATPPLEAALLAQGFSRPSRPLDKNASFVLDLAPEPAALEGALSSNWGHNLRRGLKRAPARPWDAPDAAEVLRLYRAMESYKGIAALHDDADFASQLSALGPRLVAVRVDGPDGPLALRAAAVYGGAAWDLLAATTPEGRRCYASYSAFWALALAVRARGARSFELGGADAERAKGVHDFKKGTGARPVQYLGEWDWARPAPLRPLADRAVGWRLAA